MPLFQIEKVTMILRVSTTTFLIIAKRLLIKCERTRQDSRCNRQKDKKNGRHGSDDRNWGRENQWRLLRSGRSCFNSKAQAIPLHIGSNINVIILCGFTRLSIINIIFRFLMVPCAGNFT